MKTDDLIKALSRGVEPAERPRWRMNLAITLVVGLIVAATSVAMAASASSSWATLVSSQAKPSAMYVGTFQPLSGPLARTSSAKRVLSKFLPTTLSCNFSASSSGLLGARLSLRPTARLASAWHQSAFSRPKASSSVRPHSCAVSVPTVTETFV